MTDPLDAPDAALARRLRDDPDAAHRLEELRRAAYGRDGSTAPLVEVPADLRARTGYDDAELPAPLVALLVEEARLVDEGAALLAAERPAVAVVRDADADDVDVDDADDARAPRRPRRRGALVAIVAGVVVIAGIGAASAIGAADADRTTASPATSEDVGSAVTATSTPRGQAMGTPDGRRGSVVPDFTADPPVPLFDAPSAEESAARLRADADTQWEGVLSQDPDAVRPDVPVERLVDADDWMEQHAACLREEGVDVSLIGTGDDARLTVTDADPVVVYSCAVRFPSAPSGTLTVDALAWLHGYYLDFLLPCYAAEGRPYEGEVPSLSDFTERARTGSTWTPFPPAMSSALAESCPPAPAALR